MNLKRSIFGRTQDEVLESSKEQILELQKAAELEEIVRNFFNTPLGKYLDQKLQADRQAALLALASVDRFDLKALAEAQDKYHFVARLETYLAHAIIEGQQANVLLNNRG